MRKKYAIGADIGGSHISTVLIDMDKENMLTKSHAEQKVDNQASSAEILKNWAIAIKKSMDFIKDGRPSWAAGWPLNRSDQNPVSRSWSKYPPRRQNP